MFIIYLIINNHNNKKYVGITNTTLQQRWARHCSNANVLSPKFLLHRAIKKYGINSFEVSIIDEHQTLKDALLLEQQYIKQFRTFYVDYPDLGYNMTRGGDGIWGYKHSAKTKEKIRQFHQGRTRSTQTCKAISASKIGKPRPEHVQTILKACRQKYCGLSGKGANNPNAKHWIIIDTITSEVHTTSDFKQWCAAHDWKVSSAYSAANAGNLYKRKWKITCYSSSQDNSVNPKYL